MSSELTVDDGPATMAAVESPAAASGGTHFQHLPLSQLSESATNPRRSFPADAMRDLTESVRQHGVLVPLLVRPIPSDGVLLWEIVAGARRFRAAKAAGLHTVPTLSRAMTDRQAVEAQVIENLQRADLHPIEEARGYRTLIRDHGYTAEQLATAVHKSEAYIYGRLKLCDLPKDAAGLFEQGLLDASHALLVARIPVPELADQAAREIAFGEWVVRRFGKKNPPANERDPMSFRDAKDHIQERYMLRLGTATFDTKDASLVPNAGSCTTCLHRTGNSKTLFGDVDGPDLCTNPACFRTKADAAFDRKAAEVKARGGEVLQGKAVVASAKLSGTVGLDSVCHEDPKRRTYRKLLGKVAGEMKPTLVRDERGDVDERVPLPEVRKILKEKGITKAAAEAARSPVDKKAQEQVRAHKRRLAAVKIALPALRELAAEVPAKALLQHLVGELGSAYSARSVMKEHGIALNTEGITAGGMAELQTWTAKELTALVVELLAGADRATSKFSMGYSRSWKAACALAGLDMGKFEAADEKPAKRVAKTGRAKA